jgi:hypothetical protein
VLTHSPYVMDAMRYIAKFAALVWWNRRDEGNPIDSV